MEETKLKGIERLKNMLAEFTNGYSPKAVIDYLITREDMDDKFLNEEKNLKEMEKHIIAKAKNQAVNNVSMVEDKMVYSWAVLYFTLSNDLLGIKKEISNKETKTEAKTKSSKKSTTKETVVDISDVKAVESELKKVDNPQVSMFVEAV
jgi:hypothetical protein